MDRVLRFVNELKRRKVFQVASIYLMMAWGTALGASELLPNFGAPPWVIRALVVGLLLLFPIVVALAWYLEWTAGGVRRDQADLQTTHTRNDVQAAPSAAAAASAATMIIDVAGIGPPLHLAWQTESGPREALFRRSFIVGRDSGCDLSTLDPRASRQHARFELLADGWWVIDLGSSNGTLLDGSAVTKARLPLVSRLELGKGGQEYTLSVGRPDTAATIIS